MNKKSIIPCSGNRMERKEKKRTLHGMLHANFSVHSSSYVYNTVRVM